MRVPLTPDELRAFQEWKALRFRHLRPGGLGAELAATAGATTTVLLVLPEPDALYGVCVTPNWGTTVWVTGKTTTQFTANFGTAAGAGNKFDWHVFRREP